MKLLLDTHIFVWAATNDPLLPDQARAMISDPSNIVSVSAVSSWEIAIKVRSGKWAEARQILDRFGEACHDLAAEVLVIDVDHTIEAGLLDWAHRDPFDRMLAAQARVDGLDLVTVDQAFALDVCRLALG